MPRHFSRIRALLDGSDLEDADDTSTTAPTQVVEPEWRSDNELAGGPVVARPVTHPTLDSAVAPSAAPRPTFKGISGGAHRHLGVPMIR